MRPNIVLVTTIRDCSHIGEWKEDQGRATQEEMDSASKNCYTVATVYSVFFVISIVAIGVYSRSPR